jgi:hypothetical protein
MTSVEPGVGVVAVSDLREPARQGGVGIKLLLLRGVPEVRRRQVKGHPVRRPCTAVVGMGKEVFVHQVVVILAWVRARPARVAHKEVHIGRTGRQTRSRHESASVKRRSIIEHLPWGTDTGHHHKPCARAGITGPLPDDRIINTTQNPVRGACSSGHHAGGRRAPLRSLPLSSWTSRIEMLIEGVCSELTAGL